jgi:sec-independent protein translocase protein TatB
MARQSELDELRREVEAMRSGNPLQTAVGLDKDSQTQQVFDDIHASLRGGEAQLHPPMSYEYPASFEPVPAEAPSDIVPEAASDAAPISEAVTPKAVS